MGQNLAWYGSDAYIVNDNVTAHVWRWAHEVVYYNFEANDCSAMCGHYTQIVWKDSTRVSLVVFRLEPLTFTPNIPRFNYPTLANVSDRLWLQLV